VPPPLTVIVSVSVAPLLGSLSVTPANGVTSASWVVAVAAVPPVRVGATAGSVSVTAKPLAVERPEKPVLRSISVKVVVLLVFGWPAVGVKLSASSALVIVAAVPLSVYVVPLPDRPVPASVPPPFTTIRSVSVAPPFGSRSVTPVNGETGASLVVGVAAGPPERVGATPGSMSVTVKPLVVAGVANTLLASLSVNVVTLLVFGCPKAGVKTSASTAPVISAAVPLSV
jgi:hypothetical protein